MMAVVVAVVEAVGPVGIMMGVNAATVTALGVIYRDCRKDRSALWSHVRELEKRISDRG